MSTPPQERSNSVRYEVHRERESGRAGAIRPPTVETFLGLDRARLSALDHALNGASHCSLRYTGTVSIVEILFRGPCAVKRAVIDVIDERVAARILNEVRFPRANELSVCVETLQEEMDALQLS